MSKSLDANFSGPFKVGDYENYLSKLRLYVWWPIVPLTILSDRNKTKKRK